MTIELKPGDKLTITLANTDGEFVVEFNETSFSIKEVAGLPGSVIGQANATLYEEKW